MPEARPPTAVVGAGFIGTAIADRLAARGSSVVVVTRRPSLPHAEGIVCRTVDHDDPSSVAAALEDVGAVVYASGTSLPAEAEADPRGDVLANLGPLLAVADALRGRPEVPLLAMSSAGTVYGDTGDVAAAEDRPLRPTTAYGIVRATGEAYLDLYRRRYQVQATALRCANVYGPDQRPARSQGIIANLLRASATGEPVTLFGDLTAGRDHVHVADVAEAAARLLDLDERPVAVNIGSGRTISLAELVELVEDTTGVPVPVVRAGARPTDRRTVRLDIGLLRRLTGLDPVGPREGIARTWAALGVAAGR